MNEVIFVRPKDINGQYVELGTTKWYWATNRRGQLAGTGRFASVIGSGGEFTFYINGTGYSPESFTYEPTSPDESKEARAACVILNETIEAYRVREKELLAEIMTLTTDAGEWRRLAEERLRTIHGMLNGRKEAADLRASEVRE